MEKSDSQFNNNRLLVQVILFALLFTVLFEALQLVIPYRAFNINDLIANGVGVIMGLMVFLIFGRYLRTILKALTD